MSSTGSPRPAATLAAVAFGALKGEHVNRVDFRNGRVAGTSRLFKGRFGRIRTVVEGPGGALYLLTSNRDGRGNPRPGDDRIVRVIPPGS